MEFLDGLAAIISELDLSYVFASRNSLAILKEHSRLTRGSRAKG